MCLRYLKDDFVAAAKKRTCTTYVGLQGSPILFLTCEVRGGERENRNAVGATGEDLPVVSFDFPEGEIVAEEEIADLLEKIRAPVVGDSDSQAPASLQERMSYAVAIINKVATKSTNLKGPFVKALKDSSATISSVVDALVEDVVRLRAVNERLTEMVANLSAQFAQFQARAPPEHPEQPNSVPQQTAPSPTPSDAHLRQVIDAVWRMMDGRLASLVDRLPPAPIVWPPLASSQPKPAPVPRQLPISGGRVLVTNSAATPPPASAVAPKTKATRSIKAAPRTGHAPAITETEPGPSSSASQNDGWTVVKSAKKSRGRKKTNTSSQPQAVITKTKRTRKLQSPKTAAVVVTVLPEAAGKGLTYAAVIKKARDTLASEFGSKLRRVLADSEGVRVARPTKCAEMRISGLDDSVFVDDVRVAIQSKTGCSSDNLRVGTIRPGQGGLGAVW
ncbi:unnamed protein product, partial [Leptidea sinapis]